MEVLRIKSRFTAILSSLNAQPDGDVVGESNTEMCDASLHVPLMTEDQTPFSTMSKENRAGKVKRSLSSFAGAVKAKAPPRLDVGALKEKLVNEARSVVKLGEGTIRNVQEHLDLALYGKAADSDCIKTLSALGFSEKDIENAILATSTEDVAELEAFLRRTQANDAIAVEKLLAMGFAHEDVVRGVHKYGSQNLDLIAGRLCHAQKKKLLRAQRKECARLIAGSLNFGDFPVAAKEDMQLAAHLSDCFRDCNSQVATCLRAVESCEEAIIQGQDFNTRQCAAPSPCIDAMDRPIVAACVAPHPVSQDERA